LAKLMQSKHAIPQKIIILVDIFWLWLVFLSLM
jgi:hypothetical protein